VSSISGLVGGKSAVFWLVFLVFLLSHAKYLFQAYGYAFFKCFHPGEFWLCMLDLEFVYLDMMSVNVKNEIGKFHPPKDVLKEEFCLTGFLH
jgi:hypothetical protein